MFLHRLRSNVMESQTILEVLRKWLLELRTMERIDDFSLLKRQLILICGADKERCRPRYPTLAVDYIGIPALFLDSLDDTAGIEDGTFVVVVIFLRFAVTFCETLVEEILTVDEIYLYVRAL